MKTKQFVDDYYLLIIITNLDKLKEILFHHWNTGHKTAFGETELLSLSCWGYNCKKETKLF